MTVKERLTRFIDYKEISVRAFERETGLSYGYVANMRKSIQPDKITNIAKRFPDLNTGWLLTGEGEMIKSDPAAAEPDRLLQMKDGILGVADAIAAIMEPQVREFAKVADACQLAVATADKLATTNAKLVDQLTETLARIEDKIDKGGSLSEPRRML